MKGGRATGKTLADMEDSGKINITGIGRKGCDLDSTGAGYRVSYKSLARPN
jgi:hypothetical protein